MPTVTLRDSIAPFHWATVSGGPAGRVFFLPLAFADLPALAIYNTLYPKTDRSFTDSHRGPVLVAAASPADPWKIIGTGQKPL